MTAADNLKRNAVLVLADAAIEVGSGLRYFASTSPLGSLSSM